MLTAIILGFLSFLKLVTILAFCLAVIFIGRNRRMNRWEAKHWAKHGSPPQWESRGASGEELAILDDISRVAEKMEKRLEALEKILEADDPNWKERAR